MKARRRYSRWIPGYRIVLIIAALIVALIVVIVRCAPS